MDALSSTDAEFSSPAAFPLAAGIGYIQHDLFELPVARRSCPRFVSKRLHLKSPAAFLPEGTFLLPLSYFATDQDLIHDPCAPGNRFRLGRTLSAQTETRGKNFQERDHAQADDGHRHHDLEQRKSPLPFEN